MEENSQKNVVNHFEAGSNCQVFNGNISGCTFAMPGSTVTQQAAPPVVPARVEEYVIPAVLADSELWHKVQQAGLVDANGQPTVSRPEAALMAYMLAKRLGISNKWKFFEQLWHRNNMRGDYNTALDQRKSIAFQEKLKNIFG
jgi:hypothetical protein